MTAHRYCAHETINIIVIVFVDIVRRKFNRSRMRVNVATHQWDSNDCMPRKATTPTKTNEKRVGRIQINMKSHEITWMWKKRVRYGKVTTKWWLNGMYLPITKPLPESRANDERKTSVVYLKFMTYLNRKKGCGVLCNAMCVKCISYASIFVRGTKAQQTHPNLYMSQTNAKFHDTLSQHTRAYFTFCRIVLHYNIDMYIGEYNENTVFVIPKT